MKLENLQSLEKPSHEKKKSGGTLPNNRFTIYIYIGLQMHHLTMFSCK